MSSKSYDRAYFERWASIIDPKAVRRSAQLILATAEFVLGRAPTTVLDIGCGTGAWREVFRELMVMPKSAFALNYTSIDPSDYIVDQAKGEVHKGGFGDLHDLHRRGAVLSRYDIVVCNDVLPFITNAEMKKGLAWIGERLEGVAWLQAMTRYDEFEGDRENFVARTGAQYLFAFSAWGELSRIAPHLYVGKRGLTSLSALERPL